jgi:CRISPR/Cas system-associated endonuclease Cas3-HD
MFADIGKALLAIQKSADEGVESQLHLVLSACVCRHEKPQLLHEFVSTVGAGSAGCARFSSAGGKQEKSRKSHAPANRFKGPPG